MNRSWPRKEIDWRWGNITNIFTAAHFSLSSDWCSFFRLAVLFQSFGCVESFWKCLKWFSWGNSLSGCHFPQMFVCIWACSCTCVTCSCGELFKVPLMMMMIMMMTDGSSSFNSCSHMQKHMHTVILIGTVPLWVSEKGCKIASRNQQERQKERSDTTAYNYSDEYSASHIVIWFFCWCSPPPLNSDFTQLPLETLKILCTFFHICSKTPQHLETDCCVKSV